VIERDGEGQVGQYGAWLAIRNHDRHRSGDLGHGSGTAGRTVGAAAYTVVTLAWYPLGLAGRILDRQGLTG
jgi:hypothetical protein